MARRKNLIAVAISHRKRIARREDKAIKQLRRILRAALRRAHLRVNEIERAIAQVEAQGLQAGLQWVMDQGRARLIIREIEAELLSLAQPLTTTVIDLKRDLIDLAEKDSHQLMRNAVAGTFSKPNIAPVRELAGFWSDGSPLLTQFVDMGVNAAKVIREALEDGLAGGWGAKKIAEKMRQGLDGATHGRTLLIARTEAIRSYRAAQSEVYKGNTDVIIGLQWLCARQTRTCAACLAMDGRLFPVDYLQTSHPACRCTMIPVTRSSIINVKPADEYVRSLSPRERTEMMGRVGSRLYESGHLKLHDFVRMKEDQPWGDSVRVTNQTELLTLARARDRKLPPLADIKAGKQKRFAGTIPEVDGRVKDQIR